MKHDSEILKRIKSYFMRRKSAHEAHAFEREIERDPFLYEAMEGFEDMLTSDLQQAMDELDDRLVRVAKKRPFAFSWQAAAITAVIVTGSIVFILLGDQSEPEDLAAPAYDPRESVLRSASVDTSDVLVQSDSILAIDQNQDKNSSAELTQDNRMAEVTPTPKEVDASRLMQKEEKKEEEPAFAAVETTNSAVAGQAASPIYNRSASSDELAVAEERTMTKDLDAVSANKKAKAPVQSDESTTISAPSAAPVVGMAAYQNYLRTNLKRSGNMPAGSVVITFEVDKEGTPKKISVSNSLCTACDAEAIRVVQNGPKWNTTDKKERITLTVPFE